MAWYIAITNPNCHRRAELGLDAKGYRSFWPKYRKWATHARVRIAKEYPILGRYLFVDIDDGDFFAVRGIFGIECLLTKESGAPVTIPPEVVFDFMKRYLSGEWDFVAKGTIPDGARIEIMEGEFAGIITTVRSKKSDRITFLPPGKREFVVTREGNVRAA